MLSTWITGMETIIRQTRAVCLQAKVCECGLGLQCMLYTLVLNVTYNVVAVEVCGL